MPPSLRNRFNSFLHSTLGRPSEHSLRQAFPNFQEGFPNPKHPGYKRKLRDHHNRRTKEIMTLSAWGKFGQVLLLRELTEKKMLKKDSKIVSFGSGIGILETFLAKEVCSEGKVIGIEIAEKLNKEAKKIADKHEVKNVHFITGDMDKLPLKSKSQDLVIISSPYIITDQMCEEAHRILKDRFSFSLP